MRLGSIDYTDKFKVCDSLMFCGNRHLGVYHGKSVYAGAKVYIDGLEGLWSFAKERLVKHHGVSRTWSPYHQGNSNRGTITGEILSVLCQYECDFIPLVPDRDRS